MLAPLGFIKELTENKDVLYGSLIIMVCIVIPGIGYIFRFKFSSIEKRIDRNVKDINGLSKSLHEDLTAIKQQQARHDEAIKIMYNKQK